MNWRNSGREGPSLTWLIVGGIVVVIVLLIPLLFLRPSGSPETTTDQPQQPPQTQPTNTPPDQEPFDSSNQAEMDQEVNELELRVENFLRIYYTIDADTLAERKRQLAEYVLPGAAAYIDEHESTYAFRRMIETGTIKKVDSVKVTSGTFIGSDMAEVFADVDITSTDGEEAEDSEEPTTLDYPIPSNTRWALVDGVWLLSEFLVN